MFKILLLFALLSLNCKASSQPVLYIKELNVSQIDISGEGKYPYEGMWEGPIFSGILMLENNSNDTISLSPSASEISISFFYSGVDFQHKIFPLAFLYKNKVVIAPGQIDEEYFECNLLLGTGLLRKGETNYTREMLAILPTLRIRYVDLKYDLKSIGILKVKIIDNNSE